MKHVIITDQLQDKIDAYEIAREAYQETKGNLEEKREAWVKTSGALAFAMSISIELTT